MFGTTFYHGLTRKYVIAFGTCFNDIIIERTDSTGGVTQTLKVPLTYAPKDKMIARVNEDATTLNRETAINLPIMSFELASISYDSSRHLNTLNMTVRKKNDSPNSLNYQYQSVPWNLNFNLYIYVKNAEDGTKIVDQLLPYFKPQWDMTLHIIPEMNIKLDVPINIGDPTSEDKYDGAFTERRVIIWTIPFTMKAAYYGPIKQRKIIKFSKMDFKFGDSNNSSDVIGNINVQPGLTANGQPTTDKTLSVDPNVIEVDDDFGFVVESSGLILNE